MTDTPPGSWKDGLEPKEIRFVEEYLVDLNGTQAILRAGYTAIKTSAASMAYEYLRKPRVAEAVTRALAERPGVTQTRIVDELAKVAFARMSTYAKWGPDGVTLNASDELDDDDLAAVSEVGETVTKDGGSKRIKLHDKLAALLQLGKVIGMFTDKHELTGKDGAPLAPEASPRDLARAVLDILRSAQVADEPPSE